MLSFSREVSYVLDSNTDERSALVTASHSAQRASALKGVARDDGRAQSIARDRRRAPGRDSHRNR